MCDCSIVLPSSQSIGHKDNRLLDTRSRTLDGEKDNESQGIFVQLSTIQWDGENTAIFIY